MKSIACFCTALLVIAAAQLQSAVITGRVNASTGRESGSSGSYSRGVYVPAPESGDNKEQEEKKKAPRIVVWAVPAGSEAPFRKPAEKPEMVQKNKQFLPDLLVVQKGATVGFPNLDPIYHNVFSYSRAKRFDLGRYEQGKSKDITFDEAGVVEVYCEIHETMHAYILVVDTPWFTRTDDDGEYRLEVPAGSYRVFAWVPNRQSEPREVELTADETRELGFSF